MPSPSEPPPAASLLELGQFGYASLEVWLGGWTDPSTRRQQATDRLQALIRSARAGSPLYQRMYRELPAHSALQLSELPVVTKRMVMADVAESLTDRSVTRADLESFVADPSLVGSLLRKRYAVWTSSGTSGEPGMFVHDTRALAIYEALEMLRFRGLSSFADYTARILSGERFALVMVTGGHFASISSAEHLRRTFPWLASSIAPFSLLAPLDELVRGLNDFRPTLLATYPTAAEMLADEQEAGRLNLRLSELWTGGEFLAPFVKARLQQVLNCRVRNGYGASEFLSIASECSHGALHVNDDWVLLEPVDEQHRPVPPGTPSHTTLLTNLANHVQPLIRYDLGDSITVLPACRCGSTLPAIRVEGRRDDVLHFPDAEEHMVSLLPLVLTTVIEEEANVHDFQLIQTGARTLRIAIGAAPADVGDRVRKALRGCLARHSVHDVAIEIDCEAPARGPRSGKLRRVVCAPVAQPSPRAAML
jgi:phenylacetate-coenzyme A ligase PaaK-like adenylate-forming protein